jgi:hypothetical protein
MSIEPHLIDESNKAYHARTELSASMLKNFAESPRLFEAHYVTKTISSEPSPAMMLGTAVHTAILEPMEYRKNYVTCPHECSDKRTNAYKAWAAGIGDREVLSAEHAERVEGCVNAVKQSRIASEILNAAQYVERSFSYTDFLSNVPCRVRFDAIAGNVIVDLKTVSDGSAKAFENSVAGFGYHLQAVHYLEGLRTIEPGRAWHFVFITLETVQPFRCRVFRLCDESLSFAESQRMALLEDYSRRKAVNDWSEIGENEVATVSLPNWYKAQRG